MTWLTVKNWQEYQHYKDRCPPWIKLHVKILNDRDFASLSCASRGLLMQLWILASENEGKVPHDIEELKFRLRDKTIKIEDVNLLISKRFLKNCKQPLAEDNICSPETETETETECVLSNDNTCPQAKLVDLYHEVLPEMVKMRTWGNDRQKWLRTRWKEDEKRQSLEWWRRFFNYIRESDFLMGRVKEDFQADLEWIVRPKNFAKIIDGKYHRN